MTARSDGGGLVGWMVATAALAGVAAVFGWLAGTGRRSVEVSVLSPGQPVAQGSAAAATRLVSPPQQALGAGSCTSTGCHAAAIEVHPAWQSSYTVWATRDPHARAEAVLHEPLAARIVALLSAVDPARPPVAAHEHTACIGCHAPGPGRLASEGVGCEACHGRAGDWLVAHSLPDWKAANNKLGMVDLADPFVCGQMCAGCHVGGPPTPEGLSREVSHDLIAAGHPRLAFDLRSFKQAEPPHWRDRFAAASAAALPAAGSAPLDPLDEWALGRLGSAHAFIELIARQARDRIDVPAGRPANTWPEFTAFDCYACHRPPIAPVDRNAATTGRSRPLGVPGLQPLQWALLDLLLPADAAGLLATGDAAWRTNPAVAPMEALIERIEAARAHVGPTLAAVSAGDMAGRIVDRVDPAAWDEAAAAHAALTAVVDRAATRGAAAVGPAVAALERLRRLLEFSGVSEGRPVRFDSPRFDGPDRYDARAVATELQAVVGAIERLD
jgi:hypothetical protein